MPQAKRRQRTQSEHLKTIRRKAGRGNHQWQTKTHLAPRNHGSGLGSEVEVFLTSGYENSLRSSKGQSEEELVAQLAQSITAEIERLDKRDEKCKNKKK